MNILSEFKKNVELYADKALVVDSSAVMSFIEADKISDAIASFIYKKNNTEQKPVIIRGHKENFFIPAILACLKTGCPYVPVESSIPQTRLQHIIDDTAAGIVVDLAVERLDLQVASVLTQNDILTLHDSENAFSLNSSFSDEDIAYILFTSGSTGRPKGVPITYRSLAVFVANLIGAEWLGAPMADYSIAAIYLNQVSYSFDVSILSLYPALCSGGTLFSVSSTDAVNMKQLHVKLADSEITTWVSTPSFAELCLADDRFNEALLPALENLHFCGEVLSVSLCKRLKQRFTKCRIFNLYGPTEATVAVTALEVTDAVLNNYESIPIGVPEPHSFLFLADAADGNSICSSKGEIIISGEILSPGYLDNEAKTRDNFRNFTVNNKTVRGYKTGDLGSFKDNMFHYHGRMDFQTKLNGHRIELLDIEENLKKITGVRDAAVLPFYQDDSVKYLEAFVLVNEENSNLKLKTIVYLKQSLASLLPQYMLPRKFNLMETFPLNSSGKVDRKKLQSC